MPVLNYIKIKPSLNVESYRFNKLHKHHAKAVSHISVIRHPGRICCMFRNIFVHIKIKLVSYEKSFRLHVIHVL